MMLSRTRWFGLFVGLLGIAVQAFGAGGILPGNGTAELPYQIEDLADFNTFTSDSNYWAAGVYTELMCDLDLSVNGIYADAVISDYYNGVFNGQNHCISNLTIKNNSYYPTGLFICVDTTGILRNLNLEQVDITGYDETGSLCGILNGTIDGCQSTGIVKGKTAVGGLCGSNNHNSISNSTSSANVNGESAIGGICGFNRRPIINCSSSGNISGLEDIGGLCGINESSILELCHSSGTISGLNYIGGLCGRYFGLQDIGSKISKCYSTATIEGDTNVGGLCGSNEHEGIIELSYTDGMVVGQENTGGLCGYSYTGSISSSYSNSTVMQGYRTGGFCGFNEYATITDCYSTGTVTGGNDTGGFCGANLAGTISRCYSTGNTNALINVGGFCGINWQSTIEQCYSIGQVNGTSNINGFCGLNGEGTISDSFWDIETSGIGSANETVFGAKGHTTDVMQTEAMYINAGWDFDSDDGDKADWNIASNSYPNPRIMDMIYLTGKTELYIPLNSQRQLPLYISSMSGSHNWELIDQDNCDWISSITPNSGTLTEDGITAVTIDIDSGYASIGTHVATLHLMDGTDLVKEITITLVVTLQGIGTEYLPYQIKCYDDFLIFADPTQRHIYWSENVYTRLDCDLDMDPTLPNRTVYNQALIGTGYLGSTFAGVFDGNNHTISNIVIDTLTEDTDNLGLFGGLSGLYTDYTAVKNLSIQNIMIYAGVDSEKIGGICGYNSGAIVEKCNVTGCFDGGKYTGGICGRCHYGRFISCKFSGTITNTSRGGGICGYADRGNTDYCSSNCTITGGGYIGGLFGAHNYHNCTNSYSIGTFSGYDNVGGLSGKSSSCKISNCFTLGQVSGYNYIGGFCGENSSSSGNINNCFSKARVSGTTEVGGFCGYNNNGKISNCYSTGEINANKLKGGFCGVSSGTISQCFWDVVASGYGSSGDDNFGATGRIPIQMQDINTYLNAGWDFVDETENGRNDIWRMPYVEPGYPMLFYQKDIPGDLAGGYGVDMDDFATLADDWQVEDMATLLDMAEYWLAGK